MQVAKDVAMNAVDDNEGDAVKKTSNSNSNSSGTQAAALAAKLWTTG
jgi:hypothetical protein